MTHILHPVRELIDIGRTWPVWVSHPRPRIYCGVKGRVRTISFEDALVVALVHHWPFICPLCVSDFLPQAIEEAALKGWIL